MDVGHPALVLGLSETGLGVVRALGRAGITVYGFDGRKRIGARSRFVKARRCPDPRFDEAGFVDQLLAFAREHAAPPVLFIASDVFLAAVARAWQQLEPLFTMLGPPPDVVARLIDKHELYQCCLDHGIAVPRSVYAAGTEGLESTAAALSFPVFVKPSSAARRRGAFRGPAKGEVAADAGELRRIVGNVTGRGGDVIIQEIVEGPDAHCCKYCACIASDGRPLVEFTMQKLRNYPAHFGVGSCCVSRPDPDAAALGRRVLGVIGYRGVGSIEFKRDSRDGQLKLIEINARYWQQVALATACGMNFPLVHYLEATGQGPEPLTAFRPGVRWISLDIDAASCLQYRREGSLTWTAWRKSLRGPRVISEIEWPDLWPALGGARPWRTAGRWARLLASFATG
jgi:predicted ATP-grasp superfamily ATP-dependent carboligase